MFIPSLILRQLYTFGSLENRDGYVRFAIKNRLSDARVTELTSIKIDGREIPLSLVTLEAAGDPPLAATDISPQAPIDFPLRRTLDVRVDIEPLPAGKHTLEIRFRAEPFGKLKLEVEDAVSRERQQLVRIPRDRNNDYSPEAIKARQRFLTEFTGT